MTIAGQNAVPEVAGRIPAALKPILALGAGLLVVWALLYRDTLWSLVSMWARSETFMHGFLILPLSAYLIYVRRDSLRGVPIEPYAPGIVVLIGLGAIWFAGWSASAEVVQQFAVIAMIPTVVVITFGLRFAKKIAGPLAYLFFAVPFGEIFIYPLREFTAASIMAGLKVTGISVVRSGFYLSTSAGDFAVERACSGLRYLIASFALGTLFAMLFLTSTRRRVIFIALSLIVPVFANGLRAYLIVVLAHLSSLKIAAGVDHIIYGWIFFGIVMLMLFWFGARMEDRQSNTDQSNTDQSNSDQNDPGQSEARLADTVMTPRRMGIATAAAAAAVLIVGPVVAQTIESHEADETISVARLPEAGAGWVRTGLTDRSWVAAFPGNLALETASYSSTDTGAEPVRRIDAAIASYGERSDAGALIGYGNRNINSNAWRESAHSHRIVELPSGRQMTFSVVEAESPVTGRHRVIWYSYVIDSKPVNNDYWGKALQAWTRIVSPGRALWSLALSAEGQTADSRLDSLLDEFAREHVAKLIAQSEPQLATN